MEQQFTFKPNYQYYASYADSDEEEENLQPRAFDIGDDEEPPEAGPPADGFDYLKRVRSVSSFFVLF